MDNWTFLTNHARVLLCIAHDPGCACATSRSAWASPNATPTASSPTWPRPVTWSSSRMAAATATRSRRTCRSRTTRHGRTVGEVLALLAGTDGSAATDADRPQTAAASSKLTPAGLCACAALSLAGWTSGARMGGGEMATADPRAQPVCAAGPADRSGSCGPLAPASGQGAAPRSWSCTRVAMRRSVRSKLQVPEQIKESGRRRFVCGVFEDRARRLKVPGDGVVIRRGQAGLNLDRRHVRPKLPGLAVRKTQRGLSLELAHDLANRIQVEVTDRDSPVGPGATGLDGRADGITLDVDHRDRGKCPVAWSGASRDRRR